jgi:hypothetical protein
MTPKEKAKELVDRMWSLRRGNSLRNYEPLRKCALIAVDEILEEIKNSADKEIVVPRIIYWEKIKQEIEKL